MKRIIPFLFLLTIALTACSTSSSQPINIDNLYCEYNFCIGHPEGLHLADLEAPDVWSYYPAGYVFGGSDTASMLVDWQVMDVTSWDSATQITQIQGDIEVVVGSMESKQMGSTTVNYIQVAVTSPEVTRNMGYIASWYCGDRAFRLKIFSTDIASAQNIMESSLSRFACGAAPAATTPAN